MEEVALARNNRTVNLVIAYFSSQPNAGSVASKEFLPKLNTAGS